MFLGIDGGGSKTAGVLITREGEICAEHGTGPSSIVGTPSMKSLNTLRTIVEKLCLQAGIRTRNIDLCAIGLNGVDFEDEYAMQHSALFEHLRIPINRGLLVNDAIVALWGGSSSEKACILQHGSGITSAFRSTYGHEVLFDHLNTGDVFDIRYELVTLIARMIDGRHKPTGLKEIVLDYFQVNEAAYHEAVFRQRIPQHLLRSTIGIVVEQWQQHDEAASWLVHSAIDDYVLAAKAMLNKIDAGDVDVVFGGGVIMQFPQMFWELIKEKVGKIYPHAVTHPPRLSSACGAAVMAAYHGGCDPCRIFSNILDKYALVMEKQNAKT
ncbi:MAG: hypothetical protein L6437_16035 [Kiritimatiellae bacterium]|nr:hypothetical protein [Kiritimatiellia bacterium]